MIKNDINDKFTQEELKEEFIKGHYKKSYSDDKLMEKLKSNFKKLGVNVIYTTLLLFYALQNPATPAWAKAQIVGALGYFIFPIDLIPDLMPVVGYSDDIGILMAAIVTVAIFINDDMKRKAREQLTTWFGEIDEEILAKVDEKIN